MLWRGVGDDFDGRGQIAAMLIGHGRQAMMSHVAQPASFVIPIAAVAAAVAMLN